MTRANRGLDQRSKVTLILLIAALAGFSAYRLWFTRPPDLYSAFGGRTMGTTYEVKVASAHLGRREQHELATAIADRLDMVNGLMSTYDATSEISRFNAAQSIEPFVISHQTLAVLLASEQVSERSGGAFDVTVGPLVEAWGFGVSQPARPPESEALRELRARVGYRELVIDANGRTVRKNHPDSALDLSAIAKGYGVDQAAEVLEERNCHNYLVEVGGELRAAGQKLDGTLWRVAIERPSSELRAIHEVISLADRAMATSGDYRNYYEDDDGKRVSHTIDPRTGRPVQHRLASVTVVHESAMYADALATALEVLGPEEGYALAVREDLAAYFIVRESSGGFVSKATPAFEPLLEASKTPGETR